MKLEEFVEKNIEHNTMVRLLTKIKGGHCIIEYDWNKVYMNHDIKNTEYKDWEALYVTGILCNEGHYPDAINIVIVDPNPYRSFINNLRNDEDMIRSYKDNIAMAFKDYFDPKLSLHQNANVAAEEFIKKLLK